LALLNKLSNLENHSTAYKVMEPFFLSISFNLNIGKQTANINIHDKWPEKNVSPLRWIINGGFFYNQKIYTTFSLQLYLMSFKHGK
jgi:hypothetical protein